MAIKFKAAELALAIKSNGLFYWSQCANPDVSIMRGQWMYWGKVKKKKSVLFYLKQISWSFSSPRGHRNAQKKEIIKAYRKLAQRWHPDNFQDPEEKKRAEKKFIDIAQAKEVLTDPGKECGRPQSPEESCYCQSLSKCQASGEL